MIKNNVDKQYFEMLETILESGVKKGDRTGTGTISIFDYTMKFDMKEGLPVLTSKKIFLKGIIHELLWFLKGDTNIKYLVDNDVHIWDGDCYKYYINNSDGKFSSKEEFINEIKNNEVFAKTWGELGPIYGRQWRSIEVYDAKKGFLLIDQIKNLIHELSTNPDSRRLLVNSWNVRELDKMKLPPCHFAFQCYTTKMTLSERKLWYVKSIGKDISYAEDFEHDTLDEMNVPQRKLSLKWMQRSCDFLLGIPFNITSYAILLHILAKEVNMIPDMLIFNGGDCHIYSNHIEQCKLQLTMPTYELPSIDISNKNFTDLEYDDIKIINYKSSPSIKGELSN